MLRRCCEFEDSRLRRSPPDRASAVPYGQAGGKRDAFPPPCPQVGGCPQASQHHRNKHGMNLIPGKVKPSAGIPALAYSPRKLSKQPEPSHCFLFTPTSHVLWTGQPL